MGGNFHTFFLDLLLLLKRRKTLFFVQTYMKHSRKLSGRPPPPSYFFCPIIIVTSYSEVLRVFVFGPAGISLKPFLVVCVKTVQYFKSFL